MSSIQELFNKGKSLLRNCPQSSLETKLLIIKSASISEEEFYAFPETELSRGQERLFYRLISRRLQGFPLAYLLGVKEFWSIPFRVFPGVLIPRPETELLVEKVIELISHEEKLIADIGTGAGNIAVSIAKEFPMARIIATDISQKALRAAQLNFYLQKISRITFIRGSLFFPLKKLDLEGKFDFIVSNPPYVSEIEWEKLQKEIK
ncbi:MAG: peptide chain release factor N(5)-glutamine methyltransferase, partial [Candidatus Aminicenantes bacterium]|nr:peptide chain release factor N(5)-glutamine methyltransferase [Candidatus Aminicenantes bacterium]